MGASMGTMSACSGPKQEVQVETLADLGGLSTFRLGPEGCISVCNLELHDHPERAARLNHYYSMCRRATGLHVTTSCFTTWRQNRKTNAFGKAIPTARLQDLETPSRVFFFDDNLELDGLSSSSGICNLRDISTGEFVEFCPGSNGFQKSHAGRHTVVLHSSDYNSVLVKANILDAIEDRDYFTNIISQYSSLEEKVVVFMDVNSTIICNDSVQSKDLSASLLSTMFELMQINPKTAFDLTWGSCPPVNVQKKQSMKKLVKELTAHDSDLYRSFFSEATCRDFFSTVANLADVRWSDALPPLSVEDFVHMFQDYLLSISGGIDSNGITQSWFRCYDVLKARHSVMLNSFGVDTRKVILATDPDESKVMQIAVNYELWDKRDVDKFEEQFCEAS
jgi:ABC-type uncharacterized transport system auxiliary subunit